MATTITKIVDPDGTGDYTSLSNWEAGRQGDLTTLDTVEQAKCTSSGGTADTTACTIDGWTTDSSHYIKIYGDPAQIATYGNGEWSTSKYRLHMSTSNQYALTSTSGNIKLTDLQIRVDCPNNYTTSVCFYDQQDNIELLRCLFYANCNASGKYANLAILGFYNTPTNTKIQSCIFYSDSLSGDRTYGIQSQYSGAAAHVYVYNNTFKNIDYPLVSESTCPIESKK